MKSSLFKGTSFRKILYITCAVLVILFLNRNANHHFYSLASSFTLVSGFYFFYQNCYHVPELLRQKKWQRFFLQNVLIFLFAYLISAILYLNYISSLVESSFEWKHLFMSTYPYKSNFELPVLYGLGWIFGRLKRRQIIRLITATTIVVGIVAMSIFLYSSSFHRKDIAGVTVFSQKFESIEEIVALPEFKDKTVYIDMWFSNCTSCIEQMKLYLPNFKQQMKDTKTPIEYVYLARETSHPNSEQRWWNAVEKYNLKGWHYYFEKEDTELLWKSILPHLKKKGKRAYGFPHYLIAKNGKIIDYDAPLPEQVSAIQQIIELKK